MGDKKTARPRRGKPAGPELYPGHRAEQQRQGRRHAAMAAAAAEPFPGPLKDAFAAGPIRLGDYTVREFVPMDAAILRRIDSPFYRQILEILKPKEQRQPTPVADADEWAVIYLFTRSCAEAESKLNEGAAAFAQAARAAFAHNPRVNLGLYQELAEACAGRIVAAFHTALAYKSARADGDGTVFTRPPARRRTGSAGG